MTIRVVLADDQDLVRVGLRALIDREPDLEVVAEAANGQQALDAVRTTRADVVVMDVRMPVLDGLEATRRIASDPGLAGVRILVLTTFEIDEYVFEALRLGVRTLTEREREVVALAGTGLSNDEIAEKLFISPATSRTHVSRAMSKLGARDRAQLVVFATRRGWSRPASRRRRRVGPERSRRQSRGRPRWVSPGPAPRIAAPSRPGATRWPT